MQLIEQQTAADLAQRFRRPPPAMGAGDGLRLLRLHRVFGSDELSGYSPPIEERGAGPELLVHPDDADALALQDGKGARCEGLGSFAVRVNKQVPQGCVGIVVGLKGSVSRLPAFGSLEPDADFAAKPELIARG